VKDTASNIHLGQLKAARLGHAQAVAIHQEQKAPVAGRVPAAFGCGKESINLDGD